MSTAAPPSPPTRTYREPQMDPRLKPFEEEFIRAAIDNDEARLRAVFKKAGIDWDAPLPGWAHRLNES